MNSFSVNNRFVVEVYQKEALKSEIRNGLAMIGQKVSLKGLRILVDAKLNDGTLVPKGSSAWIKEETLHTAAWAKTPLQCDTLSSKFFIVDLAHVEFISPPEELPAA